MKQMGVLSDLCSVCVFHLSLYLPECISYLSIFAGDLLVSCWPSLVTIVS